MMNHWLEDEQSDHDYLEDKLTARYHEIGSAHEDWYHCCRSREVR
jgi:hypothetical protein